MASVEDGVITNASQSQLTSTSQESAPDNGLQINTQESTASNVSADTAAAEAAEAAKVAAAAAAEAAKKAEQLAAEAAKVAEAAAAEKLRLEEEAQALKVKEFVDAQSDLYKEINTKVPKVNIHICLKLEELINKSYITIEDVTNLKLNEALKDLNENCSDAFDEFLKNQESKAANTEASKTIEETNEATATENSVPENSATENNTETSMEATPSQTPAVNGSQSASQGQKIKSNLDILSTSLFKWKRANKDKLTPSGNKIQSLLQGQVKSNRRSMERPGPNADKLKEILTRTGYSHEISSGQRKYGGPPPGWNESNDQSKLKSESTEDVKLKEEAAAVDENGKADANKEAEESSETAENQAKKEPVVSAVPAVQPHGCECFVGKLPRDLFEDELIPVFEKYGRIWDLRLMIDPSTGFSKGYCFVTYCEKNDAQSAAKALNDFEIRPGKEMRVNISVANIKLFIGNIPKTKTKEELKAEFTKIVEGLADVIIYNQGEAENDKVKNRGFCFLEFVDHKSASVAKRKLGSSRFNRVFNREVAVDWADPNDEPDEETMAKVKVLYVKNLSADVTEEEVQKVFEAYGKLERVRKMKDYAFVHFEQREDAVKAMEEQNTKVIGKSPMEISLARPLTDKKKQAQQKRLESGRGNHMHNNGNNWNNGNNFNNRQNSRNFNQNGNGNNNGNRGQMNNFNGGNRNNNGNNRGGNFGGMNNGGMNRNGGNMMGNRGFNNNNGRNGNMNGGGNNFGGAPNNFNNNRNNNGGNRGGQGNFRGGNQGMNNRGGNMGGGFNGNNQALNKRKNNDNNFMNGDNGQKKGRFGANGNLMNNSGNQLMGQNFSGNGNGWNNTNFGGMQQGNDASNEFYQDNFNSNQWL